MDTQRKREPGGSPGLSLAGGNHGKQNHTTLDAAALAALRVELGIILQAAHRVAAGYGLTWPDFDRVHAAHQFVIRILAEMDGKEVLS